MFYLQGCAFYWGFTSWIAYYINHPQYTPPCMYDFFLIKSILNCQHQDSLLNYTEAMKHGTLKK